jgi:hypothetical protein
VGFTATDGGATGPHERLGDTPASTQLGHYTERSLELPLVLKSRHLDLTAGMLG